MRSELVLTIFRSGGISAGGALLRGPSQEVRRATTQRRDAVERLLEKVSWGGSDWLDTDLSGVTKAEMPWIGQPTEIAYGPSKVGIFLCQYPCSFVVKSAVTRTSRNIVFAGCARRNCAFRARAGVSQRLRRRESPHPQAPGQSPRRQFPRAQFLQSLHLRQGKRKRKQSHRKSAGHRFSAWGVNRPTVRQTSATCWKMNHHSTASGILC